MQQSYQSHESYVARESLPRVVWPPLAPVPAFVFGPLAAPAQLRMHVPMPSAEEAPELLDSYSQCSQN